MVSVVLLNGGTPDSVGLIPMWLDADDKRPAREQLNEHYAHGGGWQPFEGFQYDITDGHTLTYPGDPPMRPLAAMKFRDEMILWYPHSWIMILQRGGAFEVCRLD